MENYTMSYYICDAGSLLVGNKDFTCHLGNGIGDGDYPVFVSQTRIIEKDKRSFTFVTDIRGKFNVYKYDCYRTEKDLSNKMNIICELDGWYGVYRNCGKMLLEKWGEKED